MTDIYRVQNDIAEEQSPAHCITDSMFLFRLGRSSSSYFSFMPPERPRAASYPCLSGPWLGIAGPRSIGGRICLGRPRRQAPALGSGSDSPWTDGWSHRATPVCESRHIESAGCRPRRRSGHASGHSRRRRRRGCRWSVRALRQGCCTVGSQSISPGLVVGVDHQRSRGKDKRELEETEALSLCRTYMESVAGE